MSKVQLDRWQEAVSKISAKNLKGVENELQKTYSNALRNIKKELKVYIENYENLSFSQRMQAENSIKIAQQVQEELNEVSLQANESIYRGKADALELGYYGQWYAMEELHEINVDIPVLNKRFIKELTFNRVNGERLSDRLYFNTTKLAAEATETILTGATQGKSYAEISKLLNISTEASYKQALRIVRTESNQTFSAAKQKEFEEVEKKGINITKTWLSTLDKRTRHSHQALDGQTVEIDKKFTIPGTGEKAMGPSLFGIAKQDIHCRCTMLQNVDGIPPKYRRDRSGVRKYKTYKQWAAEKGFRAPADMIAEDIKELNDKAAEAAKNMDISKYINKDDYGILKRILSKIKKPKKDK